MTRDLELGDFMDESDDYEICPKCENLKHISEFTCSRTFPYCRECKRIYSKEFYQKHKEKIKAKLRISSKKICYNDLEKSRKKSRDQQIKSRYGITQLEKEELIKTQGNRCIICKKIFLKARTTHVDHDHKTNKVRGILCGLCNTRLGWYEKNINSIIRYLPYNPFTVVNHFELQISKYVNSPYAVVVNSCTEAIYLALLWHKEKNGINEIEIPNKTYISVPQKIIQAGFNVKFRKEDWSGMYRLSPTEIYDSARKFTSNMYKKDSFMCVSFHYSKILKTSQAGAILHSSKEFDEWARRMRFDGRTEGVTPKDDTFSMLGNHSYLSPEVAAKGLVMLHHLPKDNLDLPNDNYPDLSQIELFK